MQTKTSKYKHPEHLKFLRGWTNWVQQKSSLDYNNLEIPTCCGSTHVSIVGKEKTNLPPLVCMPGFRTCGMFWDLGDALKILAPHFRIYLIDVVGQPGLSSPVAPSLKGLGYGIWLKEVVEGLQLEKAHFMSASFGAILIMKLANIAPKLIDRIVFGCPAGFSDIPFFSSTMAGLLWPVLFPKLKNIHKFTRQLVFTPQQIDEIGQEAYDKCIEFNHFAIKYVRIKTDPPTALPDAELQALTMPSTILIGSHDNLFPEKRYGSEPNVTSPD